MFTGCMPVFQSNDDQGALLEIGTIFGKKAMKELAASFSMYTTSTFAKTFSHTMGFSERTFDTNIPTVAEPQSFYSICTRLCPSKASDIPMEGYELLGRLLSLDPSNRITAQEALRHPFLLDSL